MNKEPEDRSLTWPPACTGIPVQNELIKAPVNSLRLMPDGTWRRTFLGLSHIHTLYPLYRFHFLERLVDTPTHYSQPTLVILTVLVSSSFSLGNHLLLFFFNASF